jgi:hypothetical protein
MFIVMPWGYLLFHFSIGTSNSTIISAVADATILSCSLGRQYRQMHSLSFYDFYGVVV